MSVLQASVGYLGKNLENDVETVQSLLKSKGFDPKGIDGVCGKDTIAAIRSFQATFMTNPDGLIEPGRKTWLKLAGTGGAATADLSQWCGDSARWSQEKKLQSMHPELRQKVAAVLQALAGRGFQPKIFYGWRSVAVQMQLYYQGNSKVKFSFHNAQYPDGTPNAYAADIVDSRFGWAPEAEQTGFWKALGEEAKELGLVWGGDWVNFRDWAHVQLVPNDELGRVKRESGL
ncbi:peptidoglycan-binding protein [Geobacter grbiciae]|uniref:peptidoglycan-binding protein n=1 Tax=Geobacter grbiciae TaxID=155042 RepID=UPI001C01B371|nr:peptidoglycan-binding protein [Geobacter grbiciae]MBT1074309.1 M15 family metallopeptidase [Geobacter grbiciae]